MNKMTVEGFVAEDGRRVGGDMTRCKWCGATECECEARRVCKHAGQPGHKLCGPCKHDPSKPLAMCEECSKAVWMERAKVLG